jgi:cellulose synthase/poly-beta-1,6-N-acetylglucosamine synthase-like glycosyltransferase
VTESVPSFTILIAARPDQAEIKAVTAARKLDYPADKLEILVARGKQPSVQRNAALRAAKGELIYFLDDDSVPMAENLNQALKHFVNPQVKMLGGPNLCPPDAPTLEKIFALVLAMKLAFGPSRARYASVGKVRRTSEKELILCNLIARREAILELGGFNEKLYPNEENALMDELQKRGGKLLYDPEFIVHRRPRATLKSFMKMLITYGRGRAEQFRVHPTFGSALNFVPPMFLAYLILLTLFLTGTAAGALRLDPGWIYAGLAPLGLYLPIVAAQVAAAVPRAGIAHSLGAWPLIVLTHVLYGFGFWRGLFTRLKDSAGPVGGDPAIKVVLEHVPV